VSSIYFRDLNNGQWIGVNEKASFAPASLMKTPLLIGFLKNAEKKPELLNLNVVATEEYFASILEQNFELETKIEQGKTYTLRQVAEIMMQDSDNVAALMLSKYILQDDLKDIFKSTGVPVDEEFSEIDIRVKDFAAFFRILYNASYLNREMSELALSILTHTTFKEGIVAGVPKDIEVAHKYGERLLLNDQDNLPDQSQLHDCGIVYTSSPYILCIMTKGTDFAKQENFIADVSEFIYQKVNEN
jgi:beta-lactamase class A